MKKRILFLAALGCVACATSFATSAWAESFPMFVDANYMVWPASSTSQNGHERSGYTGVNYVQEWTVWAHFGSSSPSMCLNYVDTSENTYLTNACGNTGVLNDYRTETSYAAAYCQANGSNTADVLFDNYDFSNEGCHATRSS